jgi:tRNA A37 threonylcarbamoyladenosine biosynthesis protein TsaE
VRRYSIKETDSFLYHVDAYRLQTTSELIDIGLDELLHESTAYVLIEWAERLGSLLPKTRIDIHFQALDDGDA